MSLPHSIAHLMSRLERYMGELSILHQRGVRDLIEVVVRKVDERRIVALIKQQTNDVPFDLIPSLQLRREQLLS